MNLMVEDSKTWFEIYEVAIAVYEENRKDARGSFCFTIHTIAPL